MITSDGKTLLVKYLLGQAPSMASHIAVGCGPNPPTNTTFSVTNVALSSTTVTITTSAAHGLTTSDYIAVKDVGPFFDGVYAVASVPTTTSLTYVLTSSPIAATTGLAATLVLSSGFITLTTGTTSGLYVGQTLTKTSGTGVLATGTVILAIPSSTSLVVSAVHTTAGAIVFQADAAMNIAVSPTGTITKTYTSKKTLDMEMFRIPIESRGYIIESGIPKMTFSARLPQEERYEITELGLYSAGSNPSSGAYGSKNIFNFSANESWSYYNGSKISMPSPSVDSLDKNGTTQVINGSYTVPTKINSDNAIFVSTTVTTRSARYERCRYLGSNIMIPGNWSTQVLATAATIGTVSGSGPYLATITLGGTLTAGISNSLIGQTITATAGSPGTLGAGTVTITAVPTSSSITVSSTATMTAGTITNVVLAQSLLTNNIVYDNFNIDVSQFMPNDELRLAFSVINQANSASNPTGPAYVTLEFVDSNTNTCRFNFPVTTTQLATSRYNVVTKTISQGLTSSSSFSWANVNQVKIYSAVTTGSTTDPTFYVCLDALRFENKTVDNPLYKLVAYSPIMSSTGATLIKETGTANSIQFKMGITT